MNKYRNMVTHTLDFWWLKNNCHHNSIHEKLGRYYYGNIHSFTFKSHSLDLWWQNVAVTTILNPKICVTTIPQWAKPYSLGFGQKIWDYCVKMLWIVCVARNYLFFLSFYLVSIQNLASKLQKSWLCVVNLADLK